MKASEKLLRTKEEVERKNKLEKDNKIKTQEIQFKEWKCRLVFKQYYNQRIAIELVEIGTDEPVAYATVNIPEIDLKQSEIILKTYSENEGMLECLVDAGIVSKPIKWIEGGYVEVPVVELLISPYGK